MTTFWYPHDLGAVLACMRGRRAADHNFYWVCRTVLRNTQHKCDESATRSVMLFRPEQHGLHDAWTMGSQSQEGRVQR